MYLACILDNLARVTDKNKDKLYKEINMLHLSNDIYSHQIHVKKIMVAKVLVLVVNYSSEVKANK